MRRMLWLLVCVLIAPSTLSAADSAIEIVRKAQVADKYISYSGSKAIRVMVNGKSTVSTVKIVHQRPDLTRKEFLSPSFCNGAILLDRGANKWKYDPQSKCWEQVNWMRSNDIPRLSDNHILKLTGSEKVAGRDAYVITVTPKTGGSALYKVWVDKKSYLMLKSNSQNSTGAITSTSAFTSLAIQPSAFCASIFAVPPKAHKSECPSCVNFTVRRPTYLPNGYQMIGQTRGIVEGRCYAHLQYSNGMSVISLFERKSDRAATPPGTPQKASSVMTWVRDGVMYTLIADISKTEQRKIASSIK